MKYPVPRHFKDFSSYEAAFVKFKVDSLPKVSSYDGHLAAIANRNAIYDAEDCARDVAFENWDAWMDECEDAYERGIGPAWE